MMFFHIIYLDGIGRNFLSCDGITCRCIALCACCADHASTLVGYSNGAKHGILLKGGVHLENLSISKRLPLIKQEHLTKGKPEVTDIIVSRMN